jgi:hypothetical protein
VAKDEQLARGARSGGGPDDAKVVTAAFLAQDVNDSATEQPLIGEETATAVSGGFLKAGRFEQDQFAQKLQHLREAWFEK